jgi:hypothetical protein
MWMGLLRVQEVASMADSGILKQPACFVAMPVTTPSNYAEKLRDPSHFPHVLEHLFTPALSIAGYRVVAPTSRGAQLIHAEIIRNLEQADLVLCDLSSLNANVFFELGIRTSLNRPVALVKDQMTEQIPFDLSTINTHSYDQSLVPWTLTKEIEQLAEHVKAVDTAAGSSNDMWHYFGLTKRASPAEITGNPIEAKLDLLVAEITALKERDIRPPRRIPEHGITGKVTSRDAIPIPGAIVHITDGKGNEVATAMSDRDGFYVAEVPSAGSYFATVIGLGSEEVRAP